MTFPKVQVARNTKINLWICFGVTDNHLILLAIFGSHVRERRGKNMTQSSSLLDTHCLNRDQDFEEDLEEQQDRERKFLEENPELLAPNGQDSLNDFDHDWDTSDECNIDWDLEEGGENKPVWDGEYDDDEIS